MFEYQVRESVKWDVIVIGSGLAGVYTALNISSEKKVLLLTKQTVKNSNSYLAQGGVAAVLATNDSFDLHFRDTMTTGHGINDPDLLRLLIESGPKEVETLIKWGVPFDVDMDGGLALAREGAHSVRRIARCGDYTGRAIMDTLIKKVYKTTNIKIVEHANVTEIIKVNNTVEGVGVIEKNTLKTYTADSIVIATGGLGQLFQHTTNDITITGDGFKMAEQLGIALNAMERIQFHPTAFYEDNDKSQRFLISEALRGEGGELKDHKGVAFMKVTHPLGSLAPRDIVTTKINEIMALNNESHVLLDATHLSENEFMTRFPTIYEYCMHRHINPSKELLPVVPCCHYIMGGIAVNKYGQTDVQNIYACGEVAYTNVHGNNRLASNSLLECLVFGKQVAQAINNGGTLNDE